MKLGVLTVALGELPFEEACKFLVQRGVQMVEIGCGGFPGKAHCDAAELLADDEKCKAFQETLAKYGLEISALSSHGNMVHPDQAVAARFEEDFTNAILLAEKLASSGSKYLFRMSGRQCGRQDAQLGDSSVAGGFQ